jgi:hypothetical protein
MKFLIIGVANNYCFVANLTLTKQSESCKIIKGAGIGFRNQNKIGFLRLIFGRGSLDLSVKTAKLIIC